MTMREECTHMIPAVSCTTLKKKFNHKNFSDKPSCKPCTFTAFKDHHELWICLQCGKVGCGDTNAQDGDAKAHHTKVGDSKSHSIALHVDKDLKCWCFSCKCEIDQTSGHLKEVISLVKSKITFPHIPPRKSTSSVSVIPLPPPPPKSKIEDEEEDVITENEKDTKPVKNYRQAFKTKTETSVAPISDKPAGLTNLGNTCFMNSTLQCLASTRLLIPKLEIFGRDQNYVSVIVTQNQDDARITTIEEGVNDDKGNVVEGSSNCGGGDVAQPLRLALEISPETMTGRLRQTIRGVRKYETTKYYQNQDDSVNEASSSNNRYSSSSSTSSWYNAYRPGEVHELVAKNFRRGAQHDAHELLRTIVDMMKKDQTKAFRQALMKHYGVKKGGEGSDPTLIEMVKSLDEKIKHQTFVDEVFGGELMTTQTCLICKRTKSSHEEFLDLSLPLRVIKHGETEKKSGKKSYFQDDRSKMTVMKSLEECLIHFTEPELLTGSNDVECENCHRLNMEKIEGGSTPEEVWPGFASTKTSSTNSPDSDRKPLSKRQEKRNRKKQAQQQKSSVATLQEPVSPNTQGDTSGSGSLYKSCETDPKPSEESPSSTQTADGFVFVPSDPIEIESKIPDEVPEPEMMEGDFDIPALLEELGEVSDGGGIESNQNRLLGSKQISESLHNLNLKLEGDLDEIGDIDDFDLPACDGIGGSVSDDDLVDTGTMIDLNIGELPAFDKFRNFQLQVVDQDQNEDEMGMKVEKTTTTADEGFSEGENSMSVDNDHVGGGVAVQISQGPSATSSSRNSLSDSDETTSKSSSDDRTSASTGVTGGPKLPKVTKCPCSRQQKISRPPENLTVHFKRFQVSMGGFASKIGDHVNFPMVLDLSPYCCARSKVDGEDGEDEQVLYGLYGIVEHSGSMNWGHYVAYVKSSENDQRWFHISDSSVSSTPYQRVTSVEAYILFYERIRGDENQRLSVSLAEEVTRIVEDEDEDEDDEWKHGTNGTLGLGEDLGWKEEISDETCTTTVGSVPAAVASWNFPETYPDYEYELDDPVVSEASPCQPVISEWKPKIGEGRDLGLSLGSSGNMEEEPRSFQRSGWGGFELGG